MTAEQINPINNIKKEPQYEYSDICLSFHGPHINDFRKALTNGFTLVVNSQSGVLISENPDAVSPRHLATNTDDHFMLRSEIFWNLD